MTSTPTKNQLNTLTRKQLQDIRLTGFEYSDDLKTFNFIFGDDQQDFNKIGLIHKFDIPRRGKALKRIDIYLSKQQVVSDDGRNTLYFVSSVCGMRFYAEKDRLILDFGKLSSEVNKITLAADEKITGYLSLNQTVIVQGKMSVPAVNTYDFLVCKFK